MLQVLGEKGREKVQGYNPYREMFLWECSMVLKGSGTRAEFWQAWELPLTITAVWFLLQSASDCLRTQRNQQVICVSAVLE